VGRVATAGNISEGNDGAKGSLQNVSVAEIVSIQGVGSSYIIETSGDEEVLVLVVASSSPEVTNLLGLDVGH
jgi:hypothetical protein